MSSLPPFVIVGCGSAKNPIPRRGYLDLIDLYSGVLYKKQIEYARSLGGPHLILSAGLGPCHPRRMVTKSYNRNIAELTESELHEFNRKCRDAVLAMTKEGQRVIITAGKAYFVGWAQEVADAGRKVELPLIGLTFPQRVKKLMELSR